MEKHTTDGDHSLEGRPVKRARVDPQGSVDAEDAAETRTQQEEEEGEEEETSWGKVGEPAKASDLYLDTVRLFYYMSM